MDRVDLVGVMIGVVLEDEELGEVVGGVDDRADGVLARDADVAAVDALDREEAAELGLELGALGGGEVPSADEIAAELEDYLSLKRKQSSEDQQ